MKYRSLIGLMVLVCILFAGCSSGKFDVAGMWKDTNGATRIFNKDGTCQNVAKIDIGGPAAIYNISEKKDSNGYYLLHISQSGYDQANFYVKVISNDNIEIYERPSAPKPLYILKRQ